MTTTYAYSGHASMANTILRTIGNKTLTMQRGNSAATDWSVETKPNRGGVR